MTLTYAEMSTESRDSSEHTDTDTDTDTGEQRRGRAPRGETRRSEKGRARAENARMASYDGNDGARHFSCSENEERRGDCGPWWGARHRANESNFVGVRARIDGLRFPSATRGTFDSSVVIPAAIERASQPSG